MPWLRENHLCVRFLVRSPTVDDINPAWPYIYTYVSLSIHICMYIYTHYIP